MDFNTLPQQLGGHVRADQLVRVGVVGDDIGAARNRDRIDGVRGNADGARELHGAVLVCVFQANIENRGLVTPIQAFFQLFFADAFDGHGAILAVPQRIVKVATLRLRRASLSGRFAREERQRAWRSGSLLTRHARRHGDQGSRLVVDGPTVGPLSTVDAAEKDGAGRAGDSKIVAPREVTVQPIPHVSLKFSNRDLS